MRSPRVEGPPVLQPVGESTSSPKEPDVLPVEEVMSEDEKPPTPPMPILVEGEDYDDNDDDGSSFEILDEMSAAKSLEPPVSDPVSKSAVSPISLTNGVVNKEISDFKPLMSEFPKTAEERINGDHEEPVLEKFFRLFTPSTQDAMQTDVVNEFLTSKLAEVSDKKPVEQESEESTSKSIKELPGESVSVPDVSADSTTKPSPTKRKRRVSRRTSSDDNDDRSPAPKRVRKRKSPLSKATGSSPSDGKIKAGRNRKNDIESSANAANASVSKEICKEDENNAGRKPARKSPQRRNQRAKNPNNAKNSPGKPGRKPLKKDRPGNANAPETRYMRSPYIVSTSENDSIVSRFQVVNPALRDAAAVNILDHPFKHTVKVVPVASLAPKPWVCAFCGHGTAFNELGCLFGPYFIDIEKLILPVGCIYPLDDPEMSSGANRPEPVPKRETVVPCVPSPPISVSQTSTNSNSSRPASPVQNGDRLVNGDDAIVSEVTSEVSVCPDSENVSETNASSCRETRSSRRSVPSSFDDSLRPSSISSFRYSKAKNSQPLIVAKDVRRSSIDNDKKSKGVRQVDIAAMFFSSDQQGDEQVLGSNNSNDKSSKRVSSRRKSEPPAEQIMQELTRKFKLKLDRTDAIPKKGISIVKKEKDETINSKDTVKDGGKSETSNSKQCNESEIDTKKRLEKIEVDLKQSVKDESEKKKTNTEEESCCKGAAKNETTGGKGTRVKASNRTRSPNRTSASRTTKMNAKAKSESAKRAAKAKLETAKQTAKAKKTRDVDSVGEPAKEKSKKKGSEDDNKMTNKSKELVKSRRGRPSKKVSHEKQETKTESFEDARLSSNGEVWFHMECVLWASGTYLNGKIIVGLEETLNVALQAVCKSCHKRGAMLACVQRGCDRTFHFYCAVKEGAYLDNEQFCIYCMKHKSKILLNKLGGPAQSNFSNV